MNIRQSQAALNQKTRVKEWTRGEDTKVIWVTHNKINQKLRKEVYYQVSN